MLGRVRRVGPILTKTLFASFNAGINKDAVTCAYRKLLAPERCETVSA
jgi:hypothetical protein